MSALHDEALVIDLHLHPSLKTWFVKRSLTKAHGPGKGFSPFTLRADLPSLKEGGYDVALSSVYVPEHRLKQDCWVIRPVALLNRRLRRALRDPPDRTTFAILDHFEEAVAATEATVAHSNAELDAATARGQLAFVHAVEGAHSLDGKLENLQRLHARGVCLLTLAHFYPNGVVSPVNGVPRDMFLRKLGCFRFRPDLEQGLTDFGREVVDAMFELGMIVDLTHCTPKARAEVLAIRGNRDRPVVMSHVGALALQPDEAMNPGDDEIRQIAGTGGVVSVIFYSYWLARQHKRDVLDHVVATVKHIRDVGGPGCLAFGSDFDGLTDPPDDLKEPAQLPRLTEALLAAGVPEDDVRAFLGRNFRRVLRGGWAP